jgi:hypothetical protein
MEKSTNRVTGGCDILFMPEYMYKALLANKISLTDIDALYHNGIEDAITSNDAFNKLNALLDKAFSKEDKLDLRAINDFLYKHIVYYKASTKDIASDTTTTFKNYLDKGEDEHNRVINFINTYTDSSSIIVSDDTVTNTMDIIVSDNMVFVILRKGFTNYISRSDKNIRIFLLHNILNTLFKYKTDSVVFRSMLFKTYLKLSTLPNI